MKKGIWLLVFAVLGWNMECVHATTVAEFEASIGDRNDQNMEQGCYWDESSCSYYDYMTGTTKVSWNYDGSPTDMHCDDYVYRCIYNTVGDNPDKTKGWSGIVSCNSCAPGYELRGDQNVYSSVCASPKEYWDSLNGIEGNKLGTGSILSGAKGNACIKNCNSTTCASTAWTAKGTGYQTRIARSCSATGASGNCTSKTEYRCAAGYYGSSSNGTSGCTQCPTWTGVYTDSAKTTVARGTSNAGATAINGCYVAAGTYYDASGTFKTTGNCYAS
ncbi:MAG: hypothetical protein K2M34_01340 [Alphaproteobacteria bacterium]|nr:hypothetical protein [Alphaproteobacteria bacterium]